MLPDYSVKQLESWSCMNELTPTFLRTSSTQDIHSVAAKRGKEIRLVKGLK